MSTTKFYINTDGTLIGGFGDGAVPDNPDAIEVTAVPTYGDDVYDFQTKKFVSDAVKVEARIKEDKREKAKGSVATIVAKLALGQPLTADELSAAEDILA